MAMRIAELRKSECCPLIGQIEVVSLLGQHHLAGNGADFSVVLKLENVWRTNEWSKANDDGASCWCGFTHAWWILSIAVRVGGKPVSSRSYSYLTEAASSFFHGGVIECSSRMRGNFQVRFLEGWAAARPPGHSTTWSSSRQVTGFRWIQWVDATPVRNILAGFWRAKFARDGWFKRNKPPRAAVLR